MTEKLRKPPKPEGVSNPRFKKKQRSTAPNANAPRRALADQDLIPTMPKGQVALIGLCITQWSRLEAMIQQVIWKLLSISDEDGRIITCQNDVSANIAILRALIKNRIPPGQIRDGFMARLNRLRPLMEARNEITHGVWSTLQPDNIAGVFSLRQKPAEFGMMLWQGYPQEQMISLLQAIDHEHSVWAKFLASRPEPETQQQQPCEER